MATGLIGTWGMGTEVLFPRPALTADDVFDRPPWERPTEDNPWTQPEGQDWDFEGEAGPGFEGGGEFDGSGGFEGGGDFGSDWARDGGGGASGGGVTIVTDEGPAEIAIENSRLMYYRIEAHTADGDFLTAVPGWIDGKLLLTADKASELEFTIPYDAEGAADLVRPNTVWLRDRWGFVVDTFAIQRRAPRGIGDSSYYTIFCVGAISQLGEEVITEYDGTAAGLTVGDHVTALMDLQAKSGALRLGTISTTIRNTEIEFYTRDTTIHAALLALQMLLPRDDRGRMYVDPGRRLQWRTAIGDQTEQIITRARNVYAIDAETDYSRMVNRIYLYGEGQDPETRLTLQDAGEDEVYLDNAASIALYDVRPFQKADRRIRRPETLLALAERILEEFATPPVTVDVQLLDLAKADDAPAGWQDLYIGGLYRVQDADLDLDTSIEIVRMEIDLARPVPVRVNLTNQVRDLSDLFSALIDQLHQPVDVDGDRYPTMGRNYSSAEPRSARAGDTRWNAADETGEMYDGTTWRDMGGGGDGAAIWYTATTKAGLPNTDIAETALGRVTAGAQQGMVCVRNPANDGWDAINFFET